METFCRAQLNFDSCFQDTIKSCSHLFIGLKEQQTNKQGQGFIDTSYVRKKRNKFIRPRGLYTEGNIEPLTEKQKKEIKNLMNKYLTKPKELDLQIQEDLRRQLYNTHKALSCFRKTDPLMLTRLDHHTMHILQAREKKLRETLLSSEKEAEKKTYWNANQMIYDKIYHTSKKKALRSKKRERK